jgi:riboflavin transporter FmnP
VSFLTFDAKDAILTVAAFIYGPVAGAVMSLLVSLLELTISDTGLIGAIMNFVSSAAFACTASLIYKFRRTFTGAIIGIFSAVAVTTGVMMLMNVLITPIYMGVERSIVISILPTLLLPFNFAKALMNAAIAMLIYKPVALALRRARLVDGKAMGTKFGKQSIVTIVIGAASLAAAIVIFVVLNT